MEGPIMHEIAYFFKVSNSRSGLSQWTIRSQEEWETKVLAWTKLEQMQGMVVKLVATKINQGSFSQIWERFVTISDSFMGNYLLKARILIALLTTFQSKSDSKADQNEHKFVLPSDFCHLIWTPSNTYTTKATTNTVCTGGMAEIIIIIKMIISPLLASIQSNKRVWNLNPPKYGPARKGSLPKTRLAQWTSKHVWYVSIMAFRDNFSWLPLHDVLQPFCTLKIGTWELLRRRRKRVARFMKY